MKNSLFGHIVTRFAAHPENVATEALCYILGASAVARTTFIDFLKGFVPELPTELMFRTQRVGKANDIPDVLGTDESGRETVIVEAKFWAGLTDNQPTAYLKRLPHGYSALLIFLVPDARLITLWPELLRRCTEAGMQPERVDPSGKLLRAQFRGLHWIGLTSWRAILGVLDARLAAKGEEEIRADVNQLVGLCDRMDSEAFLPIMAAELAPEIGRRIVQYCGLIQDVLSQLEEEGVADLKDLRTTCSSGQWGRYVRIRGNGCRMYFDADAWARYRETPLWLEVKDQNWQTSSDLRASLLNLELQTPSRLVVGRDDNLLVPLFLPMGQERDVVLLSLVSQIREVASALPDHTSEPAPA